MEEVREALLDKEKTKRFLDRRKAAIPLQRCFIQHREAKKARDRFLVIRVSAVKIKAVVPGKEGFKSIEIKNC